MRAAIRYVITVAAAILIGLAVYTAQAVVDEVGYTAAVRRIIREGWSAVVDAGYADLFTWGALFFSGVALALWTDYCLRWLAEHGYFRWLSLARYRIFPGIRWEERPLVGWSRSGDQPPEIVSVGFQGTNLTGKPITDVRAVFVSETGIPISNVMIGGWRDQRAASELVRIDPHATFSVIASFGPGPLDIDLKSTEDEKKKSAINHLSRLLNRTSGINGIFADTFIRRFGAIRFEFEAHGRKYVNKISSNNVRGAIDSVIEFDADMTRKDGVHFRSKA